MQRISSAITVCIPTFGRLDVVCDTVNQLVNAIRPGDEIIVVDQNTPSLRQQSEYFQRLCTHSSVRVIESTPANLPAARNTAARFANNDILVFVDDDVIMPWNFLDEHRLACTDQSITAVGGCWVQVGDEEENEARIAILNGGRTELGRDLKGKLTGGNFSIKKNAYWKTGGFDENFVGGAHYEDSDFYQRLIVSGYKVNSSRRAWLLHLKVPSGGCRIVSTNRPEWQNSLGFFIYAFRHGRRTGEFNSLIWQALRAGPLRKYNIVKPWRQPIAWVGLIKGMIKGWRCSHILPDPTH